VELKKRFCQKADEAFLNQTMSTILLARGAEKAVLLKSR
jgi:hypothetical protein